MVNRSRFGMAAAAMLVLPTACGKPTVAPSTTATSSDPVASSTGTSASLSGLHIGDPASSISGIGLDPTAQNRSGPWEYYSWTLADGSSLSATVRVQSGKIVYLEADAGPQ